MSSEKMKFGTKAIHAGVKPDPSTGAIMTPVFQTSTYVQSAPGEHKGYEYARTQNPTRQALEENLAALEKGAGATCFGSGLAAMDAIIKLLKSGDEVIAVNDLYGGSYRLLTKIYAKFGIRSRFVDMSSASRLEEMLSKETRLIWIETPTNPMLNLVDIEAICKVAGKRGIMVCVDNTFASPYLQTPIDAGADLVLHSATKYLGGHSDVVLGAVIAAGKELDEALHFIQNASGGIPGPQDCFLVLRGIKTLHVRVQRACENAMKVAEYLESHPKVSKVYYPGLKSHPSHELAARQMRMAGGMVSFDLVDNTMHRSFEVLKKFNIFSLAESLGGVESLVGHPASMTHASIPKEQRMSVGLTDSLIRLSVGIEDAEDLIGDLENALS